MRKLVAVSLTLVTTLVLVALLFAAAPSGAGTSSSPGASGGSGTLDGKQIFLAQKCNMCHSIAVAGIEATTKAEAMKGPDLTGLAAEQEAEWLAKWLRKQAEKDGKQHKKAFTGSDEELGALIAWLQTLKKE